MRLLLAAASALVLTSSLAVAQDVRPPAGADTSSGDNWGGGSINVPGLSDVDAPEMKTTMDEVEDDEVDAVDEDTVQALRDLAIQDGQSSSVEDDPDE